MNNTARDLNIFVFDTINVSDIRAKDSFVTVLFIRPNTNYTLVLKQAYSGILSFIRPPNNTLTVKGVINFSILVKSNLIGCFLTR